MGLEAAGMTENQTGNHRGSRRGTASCGYPPVAAAVPVLTTEQERVLLEHLPIVRYIHPDEFAEYKKLGEQMGFAHVESGPLVRSSYHAFEQEAAAHV